MLRSLTDVEKCVIAATDGEIGRAKDFYFDDESWVVRFLVVEAGSWLDSRMVLISPIAMGTPDWSEKKLPVSLTREQVRKSPNIDTQKPVSRQMEADYLGYYGYPSYWGGSGLWWGGIYPNTGYGYGGEGVRWMPRQSRRDMASAYERMERIRHQNDDVHLRSCKAVIGYHIHASDGEIGHVQGMLFDQDTWAIRFLVVNTSNWWVGHSVLVAPEWIEEISWADASVTIGLSREAIKGAPAYDAKLHFDRSAEKGLFAHYGRKGFWSDAPSRPNI